MCSCMIYIIFNKDIIYSGHSNQSQCVDNREVKVLNRHVYAYGQKLNVIKIYPFALPF